MSQQRYPLLVVHGYTLSARDASELVDVVERTDAASIAAIEAVSAARRPLLAYGAVVLDELIRRAKPKEIVISTSGVREGLLLEALDAEERRQDPLLVASCKLNRLLARSPDYGSDLIAWTAAFLASAGLFETPEDKRLREAACLLSEVNWRAHPDYRGVGDFNLVASAQLPGVDHAGRSFLTTVTTLRHVGLDDEAMPGVCGLLTPRQTERARILGAVMRVASLLAAGMPRVLPRTPMLCTKGKVSVTLPPEFADLMNDRLQTRIKQVGKALQREPGIAAAQ